MSEKIENIDEIESKVLTTTDNPFNPKTHYDSWRTWDESNGYYTEAYIARVADIPVDADTEDDASVLSVGHQRR